MLVSLSKEPELGDNMAETKTYSVKDMAAGLIADGSRMYFDIRPDHTVVADVGAIVDDEENVTLAEKVYVQSRFILQNEADPGDMKQINAEWQQVNDTRFPDKDTGTFEAGLKHIFETQRSNMGLDPT